MSARQKRNSAVRTRPMRKSSPTLFRKNTQVSRKNRQCWPPSKTAQGKYTCVYVCRSGVGVGGLSAVNGFQQSTTECFARGNRKHFSTGCQPIWCPPQIILLLVAQSMKKLKLRKCSVSSEEITRNYCTEHLLSVEASEKSGIVYPGAMQPCLVQRRVFLSETLKFAWKGLAEEAAEEWELKGMNSHPMRTAFLHPRPGTLTHASEVKNSNLYRSNYSHTQFDNTIKTFHTTSPNQLGTVHAFLPLF